MNLVLWLGGGAAVGWMAFSMLKLNARRGFLFSMVAGVIAAYVGGDVFAPLMGATVPEAGVLNPLALFMALVSAAGFLAVSDIVYKQFGR